MLSQLQDFLLYCYDLLVRKWQETGGNCIIRSFINCRPALHKLLLGRRKGGGTESGTYNIQDKYGK
jgi:hypothetical protein